MVTVYGAMNIANITVDILDREAEGKLETPK